MKLPTFLQLIENLLSKHLELAPSPQQLKAVRFFLSQVSIIGHSASVDALAMTRLTILFESFYRQPLWEPLKEALTWLREERWEHHFGVPTVNFLLTYKQQLDDTSDFFNGDIDIISTFPWMVDTTETVVIDDENDIFVESTCCACIPVPDTLERAGTFTKTHNSCGGFTTTPCDPVSQAFIAHAALSAKKGGRVLEIGAAFGAATLEAIAQGATVFCNDIQAENLAVVRQRYLMNTGEHPDSITGDSEQLILIPGALPQELTGLPKKFFDAILICRVLHFLTGTQIEESLRLLSTLLVAGGKIYIVCETPYLKNWQRFIPAFHQRAKSGLKWPGEISDPATYENSGRVTSLPKFVHWLTKEVLERSLITAGFAIEDVSYINRKGQFPEDLLLPEYGQESVGAIAQMSTWS